MSQRNPIVGEHARHSQDEWHRRSGDPRLPKWLRVAALAYGSHGNNGHATFKRGDVATTLGQPGEPLDRRRLHEHIQLAIEFGWLVEGSTSMCLIVPPHAIDKGQIGAPKAPCRVHARRLKLAPVSYLHPDSLPEASGSDPDSLRQVSGSHPDGSRSRPLFFSQPRRTET